ncbi:MAG: YidC/Oxa1 family rane protein insertase [Pseudonocardiales bacterium]|nr:YidC/Oxa1 family rane protein insertase [Pseudonocardiales bacterium]
MNIIQSVLAPLEYVVSWVLVQFHALFSLVLDPSSGWAWVLSIVGLVVVIRIVLVPLFVKQIKAQRGLQMLQPQIKEIQKKFKDDREKQSAELMKLYRETGTNPFSSCLPIIAQMPIFFALFRVLNGVARSGANGTYDPVGAMTSSLVQQCHNATFFGAQISNTFRTTDQTSAKVLAVVLIVLMSASTFLTQRQLMVKNMPTGQGNPLAQQQKIFLYASPIMFAVFGINFPIGVLVYWLTTNIWTMGQQFYVIRRNPVPGSPAHEERQARLAAKAADKAASGRGSGDVAPDARGETANGSAPPPTRPARVQPKRQPRAKRAPGAPGAARPTPGSSADQAPTASEDSA